MQNNLSPIFLHLDLLIFKINPCTKKKQNHKAKICVNYHFPLERRRCLNKFNYSKVLCSNKNKCPNGDQCEFAHNFIEQIYHPDNYKKKYCSDFISKKKCKFGNFCALAHSDMELKIQPLHLLEINENFLLFHFKSEFCPFSKINHDRFTCVYAHNWQDFKRPYNYFQLSMPCQFWNSEEEIIKYHEGCPKQFTCNYCHGWKELEYHIQNFKKKKCNNQNCQRIQVCSFLHEEKEVKSSLKGNEFFYPIKQNLLKSKYDLIKYFEFIQIRVPKNSCFSSVSTLQTNQKSLNFGFPDSKTNLSQGNSQSDFYKHIYLKNNKKQIKNLVSKSEQLILPIKQKTTKKIDLKAQSTLHNEILKFQQNNKSFDDSSEDNISDSQINNVIEQYDEDSDSNIQQSPFLKENKYKFQQFISILIFYFQFIQIIYQ